MNPKTHLRLFCVLLAACLLLPLAAACRQGGEGTGTQTGTHTPERNPGAGRPPVSRMTPLSRTTPAFPSAACASILRRCRWGWITLPRCSAGI